MKQFKLTTEHPSPTQENHHSASFLSIANKWLVGKWRLYWNFCPECNSFAPKVQCCDVCQGDMHSTFHWSKEVERMWWQRFALKHGLPIPLVDQQVASREPQVVPAFAYSPVQR